MIKRIIPGHAQCPFCFGRYLVLEVKINKEIRDYSESVFFGLSLRQLFFSLLAVGAAVLLFFSLKDRLGTETVSWICILGATPFAALGFVRYHGMPAERLFLAFLRSEVIEPKRLAFVSENAYYKALRANKRRGCKTGRIFVKTGPGHSQESPGP